MVQSVVQGSRVQRRRFRRDTIVVTLFAVALIATIIYLGVMYESGKAEEAAQLECTMPDGTVLVLNRVTFGTRHELDIQPIRRGLAALFGSSGQDRLVQQTAQNAYMLFMSRRDPTTGRALDFEWWLRSVAVDDHGCEIEDTNAGRNAYSLGGSSSHIGSRPFGPIASGSSTVPYNRILVHSSIRPFRHSGETFKLRVYNVDAEKVAEFDVPDPSPNVGQYPTWEPESYPIRKSTGDVEVSLQRLVATRYERDMGNGHKRWDVHCAPEFRITRQGQPAQEWNRRKIQFFDAVGNAARDWEVNLCPAESAWNLQVKLFRDNTATFDSTEVWSAGTIELPESNTVQRLNQSENRQGVTIDLLGVGGSGTVTYTGLPIAQSGTYTTYGTLTLPNEIEKYEVRYEGQHGTATVHCVVPHICAQINGFTDDHWPVELIATDDRGRSVSTNNGMAGQLSFWFLNVPADAKSVDLRFIVQKGRTVEFFVRPPAVEPSELFLAADALARRGEWKEAAAEFSRALGEYEENHWQWYRSTCLQAYLEDRDSYQRQCQRMFELFRNSDDPFTCERTAKACSLLPGANELVGIEKLAERAVQVQPANPWFVLANGIVSHRAGQLQAAEEWLKRAHQTPGNSIYSNALAHLFLALTHHGLDQKDEARKSLAAACKIMDERFPKIEGGDLGTSWHDWLMCQTLRREAEATIPRDP